MSAALKSLVVRIVNDSEFRKAFIARPGEMLNNQLISPSERRALLQARRRLMLAGTDRGLAFDPFEWP
jgi:hypothetical protein